MAKLRQPSLFISHGTMYEAFKSDKLKSDFTKIRREHLNIPSAIVLFSGHWQTETVAVTAALKMTQLDEGFPPEFQANYSTDGNPELASRIVDMLSQKGIPAKTEPHRGLDHRALIPLLLLFPDMTIPVLQISQQSRLDPQFHRLMAEILEPLREEDILFVGSGGLVHNRSEIQKFGGHEIEPSPWAKEFDDFITRELADSSSPDYAQKMISAYHHKLFSRSHPTSEHFLPLVFASAFGGQPTKIYQAFQWKNLSMSAFKFE